MNIPYDSSCRFILCLSIHANAPYYRETWQSVTVERGWVRFARSSDLVAKREPKVYDTYALATATKEELRASRKPIHATYQRAMR